MLKLFPYKPGSASAKALADALGIKRLKHEGSKWRGNNNDVVLNWGHSGNFLAVYRGRGCIILNAPESVSKAVNKLEAFKAMQGLVPIPEWTTERGGACAMLLYGPVVCRTILTGHSGQGIVIAEKEDEMPASPLYVKYIKKEEEYRLHVMGDKVFFVQRKARRKEVPDEQVNWKVRNLDGGFIYANQDVQAPPGAEEAARLAIAALGLDFGAVDLVKTKGGKVFVLEVNTACGLAGTTLDKYAEAFKELLYG
jgi:glutathione synthase/RimK-type ligase-like ATP-grasp enzyme